MHSSKRQNLFWGCISAKFRTMMPLRKILRCVKRKRLHTLKSILNQLGRLLVETLDNQYGSGPYTVKSRFLDHIVQIIQKCRVLSILDFCAYKHCKMNNEQEKRRSFQGWWTQMISSVDVMETCSKKMWRYRTEEIDKKPGIKKRLPIVDRCILYLV